ncbi:MAG: NADH-quinone oxidoreductase subunit NuoG [Acidimicrobiia bacterium]
MTGERAKTSELVTISIDGKEVQAEKGTLLIRAAQDAGIFIPRFCWHERMKPVGMCRMCLVEIEGVRGLPPACTTPVADGMVVHFQQHNVEKAQDGVLEFLLINHPLDCPVCDRGGECPLQDQTVAFGPGESRFVEEKRHYAKPIPISDHVLLDRERCIQCARCTRFADEIAGDPLITFVERGGQTQVLNFPDDPFASHFSGNTVQICPVGALTAKPYRFRARPWDLDTVETSCTTCAVQCRGALQSSSNRLVRLLGVDSEPVNHGWLCDKGRYGLDWVHQADRVRSPLVRDGEDLTAASWPEALDAAAAGIRKALQLHGPTGVAVIGGARGTNEGAYSWAKLAKSVWKTDNVDAQLGDGLPAEVVLGLPKARIADADRAKAIVLLAPDCKEELPVLYLRLRRAASELGVPLIDISPRANGLTPYAAHVVHARPGESGIAAERVAAALTGTKSGDEALDAIADQLSGRSGEVVVVLGRPSMAEAADSVVRAAAALSKVPGTRFLSALHRGNVHGALDMGCTPGFLPGRVSLDDARDWFTEHWGAVPAERGLDTAGILEAARNGRIGALVVLGSDPFADVPDRTLVREALDAVPFTVLVGAFVDKTSRRVDVVLPASVWGETRGSATNIEGRVQRLAQKLSPEGTTMPDWRIAAELALREGVDFDFESADEVIDEIARVAPAYAGVDATLVRRARDGAVVPIAAFPEEITVERRPSTGADLSWEPIAPAPEAEADADIDDAVASADEVVADAVAEAQSANAPACFEWNAAADNTAPPAPDAYALRLVVGRAMYDSGVIAARSSATATLADRVSLLVNPSDRTRIGVNDGDRVRVTTARGSFTMPLVADDATASGTAFLVFNRVIDGSDELTAADLIDLSAVVTDLRVETVS